MHQSLQVVQKTSRDDEELDNRHLILLKMEILECGDLACAAGNLEISIPAIRRKCVIDPHFREQLEFALLQFHYNLRTRVNKLAMKDRKKTYWDGERFVTEYIPNEKMIELAAKMHLLDVPVNKSLLPESQTEIENQSKEVVEYHKLDAKTRKGIIAALEKNKTK